ncbi:hypothetical protein [Equine parapoxvirus]|nr:hypothetical protein [Equine parapoxvirus]
MPLFVKVVVPREVVAACLSPGLREGERLRCHGAVTSPAGTAHSHLCNAAPVADEVARRLQEPVAAAARVTHYRFALGQSMVASGNAGSARMLVCVRAAGAGGNVVLCPTRSPTEKSVVAPFEGMVLLLSPFCAFDVTPVEAGALVLAEVPASVPSLNAVEARAPGDPEVRLFNHPHLLWPPAPGAVGFAFRLLRSATTGERLAEQLFLDGRWHTLVRTPCGERLCVPADAVGSTALEPVPPCDASPEAVRRVLAVCPGYDALAFPRRCVYGALEALCGTEQLVYGLLAPAARPVAAVASLGAPAPARSYASAASP